MIEQLRKKLNYSLPRPFSWVIKILSYFIPICIKTEIFPGINITLDVTDDSQRYAYWQGNNYDAPILQNMADLSLASELTTFFDIGSNIGVYSYYFLSNCPGIQVYSFEPNPALYNHQLYTKLVNELCKFHPHNIGLSDRSGELELHLSANSGHSTFTYSNSTKSVKAHVFSFDQWCNDNGLIPQPMKWITKIDVEGLEVNVLRGMDKALSVKAFRLICIEVIDQTLENNGYTAREIFDLMAYYGYKPSKIDFTPTQQKDKEFRNVFFAPY